MVSAPERRHAADCGCVRCSGFQPGHELSMRHGGYVSAVRLAPRATEIADELRLVVPAYTAADETVVRLLALTLARIEQAMTALERLDEATSDGAELNMYVSARAPDFQRLREDVRAWVNTARRLANDLGLTPTSRAKLGLDIARALDLTKLSDSTLRELEALYDEDGKAAS